MTTINHKTSKSYLISSLITHFIGKSRIFTSSLKKWSFMAKEQFLGTPSGCP